MNIENNKKYIGSSVDIMRRWITHKSSFRNKKHDNQFMQRSWDKYGEHSFKFEILELTSVETLQEREEHWCKLFNTHSRSHGYNLASIIRGGVASDEHRKSQSDKCTTKKRTWLTDKKGNILNVFSSRAELCKLLNIEYSQLTKSKIINKQFLIWNDNKFTQKDIDKKLEVFELPKDHYIFTPEFKKAQSSKTTNKKRVWLTDLKGNILNVFESNQQAADILGTTRTHIGFFISGKVNKFDNQFLLWNTIYFTKSDIAKKLINPSRNNDHCKKQIFQFSIDGQLLNSFPSIKEAISQSQISNLKYLIDSGINNIGGSLWSYSNTVPSIIVSKNIKYVYQYSLDRILLNTFESIVEASIKTNSKVKGIQKVLSGERNHHNSFIWSRDILSV